MSIQDSIIGDCIISCLTENQGELPVRDLYYALNKKMVRPATEAEFNQLCKDLGWEEGDTIRIGPAYPQRGRA